MDKSKSLLILSVIHHRQNPSESKLIVFSRGSWSALQLTFSCQVSQQVVISHHFLQVDLSEKPSFWKALKPPAKDKCGELLTSLCYHPSSSILTLTLLKARNLKAKDINGKSGKSRNISQNNGGLTR
jgi:hypothetical protein